ncbi:hypothetical protein RCZ03_06890, partial [Capnocytophaga catalasegens]
GFSAKEIQKQLGLKRYEPVWAMVHKLRKAMGNRDKRYTLEELDEITLEKIDELAESGNAFFDDEKYHEAISQWQKSLALVPEPQLHYAQSQWFFASIGDAFFALKDYLKALQNFEKAKGNIIKIATTIRLFVCGWGNVIWSRAIHKTPKNFCSVPVCLKVRNFLPKTTSGTV